MAWGMFLENKEDDGTYNKITIGEPKKSGGETTQEVKICYKFIGNIS
jgi:hypothetical protein